MASAQSHTHTTETSPTKHTRQGAGHFSSFVPNADANKEQFANEMTARNVGPVPPTVFLRDLMSRSKRKLPKFARAKIRAVKYNAVARVKKEDDMYTPLIDIIRANGLLPSGYDICNTSTTADKDTGLKPDVSIQNSELNAMPVEDVDIDGGEGQVAAAVVDNDNDNDNSDGSDNDEDDEEETPQGCDWHQLELWAEFKLKKGDDAFIRDYTNIESKLLESTSDSGRATYGQIAAYAAAQLARQHRNFIYALLICGSHARFIRWDRSGTIVSEHFDYIKAPHHLTEFLVRYGRLSMTERGFDPTVQLATSQEKAQFQTAIQAHIDDQTKRQIPDMENVIDDSVPCHKVTVKGFCPGEDRNVVLEQDYVIQKPFTYPLSPVGRSTRAYLALSLSTDELVFLKDYWRPAEPDRVPESDIYVALMDKKVPHLAKVLIAGDVPENGDHIQTTLTQDWSSKPRMCLTGHELRKYRHIRIVQEMLFPLSSAKNSKELVKAIRNAVTCVKAAYDVKWLHRDVSAGNVMLTKDGEGVLNDWDHGLKIGYPRRAASFRTGTWQFLSIALGWDPRKFHDVSDDYESCYWVLLYNAIHYCASDAALPDALTMFNQCQLRRNGDTVMATGGDEKSLYVEDKNPARRIKFECGPLQYVLLHFGKSIATYYEAFKNSVDDGDSLLTGLAAPVAAEVVPSRAFPCDEILQTIDKALLSTLWPASDFLEDQCPREKASAHRKNINAVVRKQATSPATGSMAPPSGSGVHPRPSGSASTKRALPEEVEGEDEPMGTNESRRSKRVRTLSDAPMPGPSRPRAGR
ncbi:hypothetical protein EUX98_g5131 [Antrodiella citrinella]|uniref:Fungal-type protein kinase domain-containing protein n=1 Tax=Antrodiella citrinella TaxID=2447956 RepID=A0A4S4MSA9_9APHY|nr:hypothetical protein EUX98_g5131 [Antrodiella citrinella]